MTLRLASQAELACLHFDDPTSIVDPDQAEARLSPKVISEIRSIPIHGRIIMIDGFTIDGPDTAENQKKYPRNPAQEEGLGFPMIRCVCLVSMLTGLLVDLGYAAYSGKGTGETSIVRQLRSALRTGDIVVADSYHCTYWFLAMCLTAASHVKTNAARRYQAHDGAPMRVPCRSRRAHATLLKGTSIAVDNALRARYLSMT